MRKPAKATSIFTDFRRATCQCDSLFPGRIALSKSARSLATSRIRRKEEERYGNRGRELRTGPRWQSTPPRMIAPVRSKPPVADNDFPVNEDPVRLDKVYDQVLGRGGYQMLTEEVKWLAVTHKSFDHGRRGFNDRLAYLGKNICELQTTLALFHGSSKTPFPETQDGYGREPFRHSALDGLAGVSSQSKSNIMKLSRTAQLAESYGLDKVVRWKPRKARDLKSSGVFFVTSQALFAIVGAVALQKGGIVADEVVKERILSPLGLQ